MKPPAAPSTPVSADQFRDIIGHFASGVTIVTTVGDGRQFGSTASAVASLSLEPPMLLVCLHRESATGAAIVASRRFAVNVLGEDQPDLAVRFAGKSADKFAGVDVAEGDHGQPLIAEALATLECTVTESVMAGTHTVFLAEVHSARARPGTPLAYFRGQFGRLTLERDETALRDLRTLVIHRDVDVDRPLDLDRLARQLDVPRATVYYGLAKLVGEGLVVQSAAGGFLVPEVTLESIIDAVPALFSIWLGALELTIGTLSAARVTDLRARLDALRPGAVDHRPPEATAESLRNFIVEMVGATGSSALQEAWLRVDVATQITSHWSGSDAPEPAELTELHDRFVEIFTTYVDGDHAAVAAATARCAEYVDSLFRRTFATATG